MKPGEKPGERVIYRRFTKSRDGKILDARAYGKKAFRIVIRDEKKP